MSDAMNVILSETSLSRSILAFDRAISVDLSSISTPIAFEAPSIIAPMAKTPAPQPRSATFFPSMSCLMAASNRMADAVSVSV